MKTEKVMEQHTVTLGEGEAVIHTITTTTRRVPYQSDYHLRELLDKLARWSPCDNWEHVIRLLKMRKTYIIQNGSRNSVRFAKNGGRIA